jgi:MFS family permease
MELASPQHTVNTRTSNSGASDSASNVALDVDSDLVPKFAMPHEFNKGERRNLRYVIIASSIGTLFEWYDFYLYAGLSVFFGNLFFPKGDGFALLLSTFAALGVGFVVRPFGALVFGRLGDIVGRKHTFLVTMIVMGLSTALVGILPTYEQIGITATIMLVVLRLAQGLALGGEYGGAAIYVAEHANAKQRGFYTSFIQTTATLGFLVSLAMITGTHIWLGDEDFQAWGWRIPFLVSQCRCIFGFSCANHLFLNNSKSTGAPRKRPSKIASETGTTCATCCSHSLG